MKLAAVATHPIQYQAPVWRMLAAEPDVDLRVYFASRHGLDARLDPEFGTVLAWDIPLLEDYEHTFCRTVPLPALPGPVANLYPRGLPGAFRRERYDAVLIHGYATGAAWAAVAACALTRTPIILRGESHDVGRGPATLASRAKDALLPPLLRRSKILAIGKWNQDYWVARGVDLDRVDTALYCVDNDRLAKMTRESAVAIDELRSSWQVSADDVVFLYVAKLIERKGPRLLIETMARLGSKGTLVMVGSGPLESELKQKARELGLSVRWEGFVNQMSLPLYYAAADVFVLPSRIEPWGLVVNEAMACGTPCIVSDRVASGADLISDKCTGLVFRDGDVDDLASCLSTALSPELRAEWAANIPNVIDRAHPRHLVAAIKRAAQS